MGMARLIDADNLLELYDMGEELENYANVLSVPIPVIRQNIKDMPTADAVEVVRCKDCKWFWKYKINNNYCCCRNSRDGYSQVFEVKFSENDFCSYGERKDND